MKVNFGKRNMHLILTSAPAVWMSPSDDTTGSSMRFEWFNKKRDSLWVWLNSHSRMCLHALRQFSCLFDYLSSPKGKGSSSYLPYLSFPQLIHLNIRLLSVCILLILKQEWIPLILHNEFTWTFFYKDICFAAYAETKTCLNTFQLLKNFYNCWLF